MAYSIFMCYISLSTYFMVLLLPYGSLPLDSLGFFLMALYVTYVAFLFPSLLSLAVSAYFTNSRVLQLHFGQVTVNLDTCFFLFSI